MEHFRSVVSQPWLGPAKLAIATGIAYFLAGRLGLALRAEPGVAVFWPAAGIAVGALIALGPSARVPVAAAVVVATIGCKLIMGRNAWLAIAFGFINAGQSLLTAWLLERWFGSTFTLDDVRRVTGFLGASALGSAIAAVGAAIVVSLTDSTAHPLHVWRLWFAACSLGIVTVAPLIIGLRHVMRERLPRHELIEGWVGLVTLAAISAFLVSLPNGPWATALPETLVFPFLLWFAIRCRPVFAAAAAFVVGLTVIGPATFDIGHFDLGKPLADRIVAAQTFVLAAAILAMLLAALFAERRRGEQALKQGAERLQLALDGAELGAFNAKLETGQFDCDIRTALYQGHTLPPTTIKESRRFVHPDDLGRIDAAVAEAQHTADGIWKAEYRVIPPDKHPHAGETRWIAVEGSIGCNSQGTPVRLLGVTRDITHSKRAEQALAERNTQLALAGKVGLVGSLAFDIGSGRMQVSPGYAAIHGLPEGTTETTRNDWRTRVHRNDLPRLDASLQQTIANRHTDHYCEYRIVRPDGEIRWIEARCLISYDADGCALRIVGANIDVTKRKQTESLIKESAIRLADALAAGQVIAFEWDAVTGQSRRSDNASHMLGDNKVGVGPPPCNEFLSMVHPDDRQRYKACIRQLCRGRPSYAVTFRFVRSDAKQVWLEETAKGEFDASGRLLRIKGLTRDISERTTAELALAERTMQLELAGKAALVGRFAYDFDAEKMQISQGYAAIHGFPEGTTEIARSKRQAGVHPDDQDECEATQTRAFHSRQREYGKEYRIVRSGELRWIETRTFVWYRSDGHPDRVVGVDIDVTERKRAEEHQQTLRAELDHRVKNVLATVSAVAAHTMDTSNSMEHFVASLDGRIRSMAQTHELLSQRRWLGVPMAELLRRELAPYASNHNTDIKGPEVLLSAEASQTIAMVLHELTTNAAKYGALSKREGRVSVRWYLSSNGQSPGGLTIEWVETGGPRVKAPSKSGYGTRVVTELVHYELGGTADLTFSPTGVRCRLDIPAGWFTIEPPEPPMNLRGKSRPNLAQAT